MDPKRHLLICGEIGVGKSTLIRRLLVHSRRPLAGFFTKRIPTLDGDGLSPVYIHPAAQSVQERSYGPENLVGRCGGGGIFRYPEAFDTLGVKLLYADAGDLILMDELGFLENEAEKFRCGVLRALDGEIPVLAAVKSRDTEFLEKVRNHPNAEVFRITKQNRDSLYPLLLPRILEWNRRVDDMD
jgi:nucleoside-triphosphatase